MEAFVEHPLVERILAGGDTKSSIVVTAKVCRASWIRGRHPGVRDPIPAWWSSVWKVPQTVLADSRAPVVDTKNAAVLGCGHSWSRWRA